MVVENEFDGRVDATFVAPDANEQGHGDEHDFQKRKKRKRSSEKRHLRRRLQASSSAMKKFFYAMLNAIPGRENGDRRLGAW